MNEDPSISLVIRPAAVTALSRWTVDSAREALDELEAGDFASSALLLDAFGRDDRISACLGKRSGALAAKRGLPFEVVANKVGEKKSEACAVAAAELWWDTHGEAALKRVQRDAIGLGAFVGRLAWLPDGKFWKPKLVPFHAANLHWSVFKGCWQYRTLDGDLDVTPGDGNWVLYLPGGDLDPWMGAAVRALATPFVLRGFTWRDWARWCERHGMPIITAELPANAKADHRNAFLKALANLGKEAVIPLFKSSNDEPGFGVGLIEAKDTAHAGFQLLLERIDICTAVYLLGQNLTTEVSAGAFASTTAHRNVEFSILSGDAESLTTFLRDQVWKPWARLNYGDEDLAPWGSWDTAPPEDRKVSAETMKAFADAVKSLGDTGIPIDRAALAERFDIPMLSGQKAQDVGQIFEYHFKYGIITPNEARARLGLAGIEGGDKPVDIAPEAPPPAGDESGFDPASNPDQPPKGADGKPVLQSLSADTPGTTNGRDFTDDVATRAARTARLALAPDVAAVLAAIDGAKTFDEIKARIVVAYEGMDPSKLGALVEKALILSKLAGRAAVLEDL